jgi:hypothetical protein
VLYGATVSSAPVGDHTVTLRGEDTPNYSQFGPDDFQIASPLTGTGFTAQQLAGQDRSYPTILQANAETIGRTSPSLTLTSSPANVELNVYGDACQRLPGLRHPHSPGCDI